MAYGIQIYNSSGNLTLDTATRCSSIIVSGTVTVTTSTSNTGIYYIGESDPISMPGILNGNDNEYEIWMAPTFTLGTTALLGESVSIVRPGDNSTGDPANGTFLLRFFGNTGGVNKNFIYYGFRY